MPPVLVGVAASALATYATTGALTAAFLIQTGVSLALSAVSRALAKKPKASSFGLEGRQSSTSNVRQAITSHQIVYGVRRVGGPIVAISSTLNNLLMHLVIVVAAHEVEAIDNIWLNDYEVDPSLMDADGYIRSGKYGNGYVRIKKHLGSPTQGADADLLSEVPEWTSNHRLQGRAYIYVRLEYSQDFFPAGIPNISAVVRGKKIFDPRDGVTRFTTNNALFAYDFLTNQTYGLESQNNTDTASVIAAANICDEFVTVSGVSETSISASTATSSVLLNGDRLRFQLGDRVQVSGAGLPSGLSAATNYFVVPYIYRDTPSIRFATTFANALAGIFITLTTAGSGSITVTKNAEPRYHGAGLISADSTVGDNMIDILSGFSGRAIYAGGTWKLNAPTYITPTLTLDENDFISALEVTTSLPRSEKFNQIKGVFTSPLNDWQPTDYPVMTDSAAVTRDLQTIPRDYDIPFASREFTTQRLAKIELLKAVQSISVKARCNLRAMQLECGDNVYINNTRFGWSSKPFEVLGFKFILGGNSDTPELGVELELRETAAAIYDWSTSEQSDIDISPNSSLPNAFTVEAVSGVAFTSRPVSSQLGDNIYILGLQWTASPNFFVQNGGQYEIQFKLSANAEWLPSFFVSGEQTTSDVQQASINTAYDLRIRALNNLGVRSGWVTILNATVGTSGGVGSTEDWGLFSSAVSTTEDWGLFSASVSTTENWEFFT